MAVFTNLDERIKGPLFDTAADKMHLVHVTGVPKDPVKWRVFESILTDHPHEIPTSTEINYCTDSTRTAEELLGFDPSVYFYAGRAHLRFGNLALAFEPSCQDGRTGSVTPFDTGGFVYQPDPRIHIRFEPNDEMAQRVAYCSDSELALDEWRAMFGRVLAAYFDNLAEYWTGRPAPSDPEGLYELNDGWRSWTFEIRFYEPQPIHDRVAWCADESVMHLLGRLHRKESLVPGDPMPVDRFLNDEPALKPAGTPTYCTTIEAWVQKKLGL